MNNRSNEDRDQSEIVVVIIVGFILAGSYAAWYYARDLLAILLFAIDYLQLFFIDFFVSDTSPEQAWINAARDTVFMSNAEFKASYGANKSEIPAEWFSQISGVTGKYVKYLVTPLIIAMAIHTFLKMKGKGFTRKFTLTGNKFGPSLADYQAKHWKVFTTGAEFKPDEDEVEDQARTPLEWMHAKDISLTPEEGFDDEAAEKAFASQLGPEWDGVENASDYVKALCIIFYVSAKRDKNARKIKEEFALVWSNKDKDKAMSLTKKLAEQHLQKDPYIIEKIEAVCKYHAYTNTAMYAALTWGRKLGGVLASAEFRWIKSLDRDLWYGLNNCGRRAFHTEGAGIVSHYHAEHILKQKLGEPHIEQAVAGLEHYIEDQGIIDLELFFESNKQEF